MKISSKVLYKLMKQETFVIILHTLLSSIQNVIFFHPNLPTLSLQHYNLHHYLTHWTTINTYNENIFQPLNPNSWKNYHKSEALSVLFTLSVAKINFANIYSRQIGKNSLDNKNRRLHSASVKFLLMSLLKSPSTYKRCRSIRSELGRK